MESLDGDGHFVADVDFGNSNVVVGFVFEFADFDDGPCVPVISGAVDFLLGVNLDDADFLLNLEAPFESVLSNGL